MIIEQWDTRNNTGDGLGRGGRAMLPIGERPDPQMRFVIGGQSPEPAGHDEESLSEAQFLSLMQEAHRLGLNYQQQVLQPRWTSAYQAFNNKHVADSKYGSARWRGRSKLYRPKTRSTARKKMAEAASALFSNSDVVVVSPADEADEVQQASAAVIKELLQFRLDRASENAAVPWFTIAMGAHSTALMTGVCASKQYWEYRTEETTEIVPVTLPLDGFGEIVVGEREQKTVKVIRDRPRVRLYPPEDVIRDPAAAWEDQSQESAFVILRNPFSVMDAKAFLEQQNESSPVRFTALSEQELTAASGSGAQDSGTAAATRRGREQDGGDRYSSQTSSGKFATVWLHENFIRVSGKDHVFWSLGTQRIISNIVKVADAYPEQGGARPVTIGIGALEPFKIDPMSAVSSWMPLQQEINDVINLRLDAMKQSLAPLTLVRRGRSVDIRAIQNRSPDTVAYVQDPDDVSFDRPPEPSGTSYAEMERLNVDFDDQAGNFSIGSVQSNRTLNATVGGMNLMSGAANAMAEFDLRVWIETWCEPVLRQLVKLEQYYESDERVLTIAAQRAKLFARFGQSEITDQMLNEQVMVSVNVGVGSADPMMALNKFAMAAEITGKTLGPEVMMGAKRDAIIDEVFGKAGYKNASERFFNPSGEDDPRLAQAGEMIQQMQGQMQEMGMALKDKGEDRKTKEKIARMQAIASLAGKEMDSQNAGRQKAIDAMAAMGTGGGPQEVMEDADGDDTGMMQVIAAQQQARHQSGMQQQQVLATALHQQGQALHAGMAQMAQALAEAFQQVAAGLQQGNAQLAGQIAAGNQAMIEAIATGAQAQVDASREIADSIRAPKIVTYNAEGRPASVVTR